MDFRDIVSKTWSQNHLFSVLLELTYRCNLDCFFCYNDRGLAGRPLATSQYFELFEELRRLQVMNLILSGGEPLAHPDFYALGRRARELGFAIRVKSNGHALGAATARRLRDEVDPFVIEVSLHGATAATHDRQTRVPGSFERLMENLGHLRQEGLRVKLNSTLTAWNEGEIEAMLELARSLGLPLQVDPEVTPRDDGDTEPLDITASAAGLRRLYAAQLSGTAPEGMAVGRAADAEVPFSVPGKHCGAGSATLAVDPYGTVYPCVQWRRPLGNLHEASLAEIWQADAVETVRQQSAEVQQTVAAQGPDAALMGFCPGAAWQRTGRPTTVYPEARRKLELGREARRELLPVVG